MCSHFCSVITFDITNCKFISDNLSLKFVQAGCLHSYPCSWISWSCCWWPELTGSLSEHFWVVSKSLDSDGVGLIHMWAPTYTYTHTHTCTHTHTRVLYHLSQYTGRVSKIQVTNNSPQRWEHCTFVFYADNWVQGLIPHPTFITAHCTLPHFYSCYINGGFAKLEFHIYITITFISIFHYLIHIITSLAVYFLWQVIAFLHSLVQVLAWFCVFHNPSLHGLSRK